jgi:hypothetical protein
MQIFCISRGGTKVKTLRQICAATILNVTLAAAVFAGQVDCPGKTSAGDTVTNVILAVVNLLY